MMMNKLMQQLNDKYKIDCLKTMYACSCSCKQDNACKECYYGKNCMLHKNGRGFVNLNNLVFDFDMISVKFNEGTDFHSIDSLIVHNNDLASLIEFTDGEPRNKKLVRKSIDTVKTLRMIDKDFVSNNVNFYFVYNSQKFHKNRFDDYIQNSFEGIDDDLFTLLIDLNAEESVQISYFKLDKVRHMFKSVFAYNEKKFAEEVNCNLDKWSKY